MSNFAEFFEQNPEFLDKKVAIAFSGGSDSLALLYLFSKLFNKSLITAVYVNHNLRSYDELMVESKLNKDNCNILGVRYKELICNPGEIEEISSIRKSGTEDAARAARYEKLISFCKNESIEVIATAHNSDDQVETMIMRTFNGASPLSLSCIREKTKIDGLNIIRPVLKYSKKELRELLLDSRLYWSEDSTNNETDYLRNKIRAYLMPKIEEIFPDVHKIVQRNASLHEGLKNLVDSQVQMFIEYDNLYIDAYSKLESIVRYNVISKLTEFNGKVSFSQIKHIDSLILEGKDRREKFNGFDLIINSSKFFFEKSVEDKNILFIIEKYCDIKKTFDNIVFEISSQESDDNLVLRIADEDLTLPLILRNPVNKDALITAGGKVLINKLATSWKLDENKKKQILVLEDRKGIVAVFARHLGGRDRIAKRMKNTLVGKRVRLYSIFNKEFYGEII